MLQDLKVAALFLTSIPVRVEGRVGMRDLTRAVHAFPVMGALVGLAGGAAFALAAALGLPPSLAALLAVATMVLSTGALHEDGLADTADGLGAGEDRDRALAIMDDSRIGSFGAIALLLSLAGRLLALAELGEPLPVLASLVAGAMVSRALMPLVMLLQPSAKAKGLAAEAGRPEPLRVAAGGGVAVVAAALLLQGPGLLATAVAAAAGLAVAGWLGRRFGGCTGDTLGAVQQVAEVAFLLALVAAAA